jgi:hypothetical protein
MVSVTHTARNIEITAESLQTDLARLQVQKQALERELAAVVAHLGSVQRALSALETLMLNPAAAASPGTAAAPDQAQAATPVEPRTDIASSEPANGTTKPARAQKSASGKGAERAAAAGTETDGPKKYGKLTEQIMAYFAEVGDVDVRARDVAAALGRDTDSGSINAVRSTLDRLVGTSRVQRIGRGLYRAKRS